MIQVINGKINQYKLPNVGTLATGEMVSGYYLLSPEILAGEGWLPLEDTPPEFDPITQYLLPSYTIFPDRVVKGYQILPIQKTLTELVVVALQKIIKVTDLTPEEHLELVGIYPDWSTMLMPEPKNFKIGVMYSYNGRVYSVRQPHLAQLEYTPDIHPALFDLVEPEGVIPEYIQGRPYMVNKQVLFNTKVYTSLQDDNVWNPLEKPDFWKEVLPSGVVEDYIVDKWYKLGDRMRFTDGKVYESIFVGDNVWNPITYPQGWAVIG